jgi:uncharacterized protein YbjT (DUF2867 family)
MGDKKIITVFGATGIQGGSVADIFLNDPKLKQAWIVRAVTRDVNKEAAKKLANQGAEVITADTNDKASLVKALQGSYAVFAVTNYWEKGNKEVELRQGKNTVDAAKETGVQHFIWSSLLNVTKISGGKLAHVNHFDSKAEVEEYARQSGIPATFYLPGLYMSNFPGDKGMLRPSPQNKGAYTLAFPSGEPGTTHVLPLLDTHRDTGKFVKAIVGKRDQLLGERVYGAAQYISAADLVETFSRAYPGEEAAGRKPAFVEVPPDTFKGFLRTGAGMSEAAAEELTENMLLLTQPGYYGGAALESSHAILEDPLTTWDEFVRSAPAWKHLK